MLLAYDEEVMFILLFFSAEYAGVVLVTPKARLAA
jgi:hypothetical protein